MSETVTKPIITNTWKVIFHNDNSTPMEFIQQILIQVFHKTKQDAFKLTKELQSSNKVNVGISIKDIASTKAEISMCSAEHHGHKNLRVTIEQNI